MVDAGCRRRRGRPALQRPGDGRPDHPGAAEAALERGTRTATCCAPSRRSPRPARPTAGDDLLEPGRALRRRPVRRATSPSAGGAGLITPDLTPDEAGRVDRRRRRARPRQGLPGRAVLDRRRGIALDRAACRGFVYAAAVDGRHRRPRRPSATWPGRWSRRTRAVTDLPVVRRARRLQRRPGRRGRGLRRRRHRRLGVRARRCSTPASTERRAARRSTSSPATSPTGSGVADDRRTRWPSHWRRSAAGRRAARAAAPTPTTQCQRRRRLARHRRQQGLPDAGPCRSPTPRVSTSRPARGRTDKPLTLVFFGYTHCPDICHVVMANLASALRRLDAARSARTSGCCSSPPTRPATPRDVLRDYLDRFDPAFVGLTGDRSSTVEPAAKALDVSYEKPARSCRRGGYDGRPRHLHRPASLARRRRRSSGRQDTTRRRPRARTSPRLADG